jgi:hypothetical protein
MVYMMANTQQRYSTHSQMGYKYFSGIFNTLDLSEIAMHDNPLCRMEQTPETWDSGSPTIPPTCGKLKLSSIIITPPLYTPIHINLSVYANGALYALRITKL